MCAWNGEYEPFLLFPSSVAFVRVRAIKIQTETPTLVVTIIPHSIAHIIPLVIRKSQRRSFWNSTLVSLSA